MISGTVYNAIFHPFLKMIWAISVMVTIPSCSKAQQPAPDKKVLIV